MMCPRTLIYPRLRSMSLRAESPLPMLPISAAAAAATAAAACCGYFCCYCCYCYADGAASDTAYACPAYTCSCTAAVTSQQLGTRYLSAGTIPLPPRFPYFSFPFCQTADCEDILLLLVQNIDSGQTLRFSREFVFSLPVSVFFFLIFWFQFHF